MRHVYRFIGVALLAGAACGRSGTIAPDAAVQDAAVSDAAVDPCNPGDPCAGEPRGTSLFLQVLDSSGVPIPTAAVTVQGTLQPTDGAGRLLLEELAAGRVVARVEARGYAPATVAVDLAAGSHGGTEVRLRPLGAPIPFDAGTGAVLEVPADAAGGQPAVRVTIPPGALVDHLGNPVTGPVAATIVPLDPSQATVDTLPGPLQALRSGTGAAVELESVVMAEVSLWQEGLPVNLAPGARATLELALPEAVAGRYQVGDTIEAWWLDLDAGMWKEEGVGIIQPSSMDPDTLAWVVEVAHFTWWNCDRPWTEKHCFTVTVEDVFGNPVPDMQVSAQGVSYTGVSRSSFTRRNGETCVDIMRDGTADILVGIPSAPLATERVIGSGPVADCAGQGAACTPVTIRLPAGTKICTPGASIPCPYSGPPGTVGVGICRAGSNQCNATGTSWSGCVGEVVPKPEETCETPFDENCNGEVDDKDCGGCSIGQTLPCYSGPENTAGVGICQAGTRTCDLFNRVYGPCTGEVLPRPETCDTPEDDNCDGSTECTGLTTWSRRFGGVGLDWISGIAVDSAGNVMVTGRFSDTVDFGGGPLPSAGGDDIFVVKLDAGGQHLWSRRFGGTSSDFGEGIAVDSAGNVVVTGAFQGTVDFGGGPFTSAGSRDIFVVKLDAAGQHLWSHRFGGASLDTALAIAVDSAGNVVVGGYFQGTVDFGGGPLTSAGGYDAFVVKLDAAGQHLWSRRFGGTSSGYAEAIAVDSAGNVVVTGEFYGTVNFGGGPLPSAGSTDIFVVMLDAGGQHQWSQRFGGTGTDYGHGITVDGAGSVVITGQFQGTADFGGGPLPSAGGDDIFVVKLDAGGQHLWSRRFGGVSSDDGRGIAVDSAGNVVVTGGFSGTVDFGGGPLPSAGSRDIFVVKLDAGGQHQWSRRFGGVSSDDGRGMTVDSAGNVVATGDFSGTVDFGTGPLTSAGSDDIFVVKLTP